MGNDIEELTLLLMYLSSWEEKTFTGMSPARRCWKGFLFEVIDELDEKGLINRGSRGSKSIYLTEEGINRAEELKKKFGLRGEGGGF